MSTTLFALLASGAFFSALLSGVAGMGGGLIYLPFLAAGVGVRKAIPLLACLLLVGNITRAYLSRGALKWDVALRLLVGSVPGALVGAALYTTLSVTVITRAVGIFLLLYVFLVVAKVPWPRRASLEQFPYIGAVAGFLSAITGGAGPVMAPFFLRFGLVKEAFLSTAAVAAAGMHVAKIVVYAKAQLITRDDLPLLIALAALMILGTWVGKIVVSRMHESIFRTVVTFLLALIGLRFILTG